MRAALTAGCVVTILLGLVAQVRIVPPPSTTPILYTSAKKYAMSAWMKGDDRFPLGAAIFIQDRNGRRPLLGDFFASADPAVSPDGSHLLFAGKKTSRDCWQIWEASIHGDELRRITACRDDCVRPLYLPDDRIVYAQRANGKFAIVATARTNGSTLSLTYSPANFLPTDILRDGRILFESASSVGGRISSDIYTVYSDGSGVESYRCDHGSHRHSGKQVNSGDVVFAEGPTLARFTSALARQIAIPVPSEEYAGDVVETPDGDWLLTSRPGPGKSFAISLWKPGTHVMTPLVSEDNTNAVQPTLIQRRPVPKRLPSALHDWSYANLLCLNAYTSKSKFSENSIAAVRLYARTSTGSERLLGEAQVEKDGSFYLRTPADQPLKIELLDAQGRTLKKEAGWFWLRRGEQRVCVGCHAGPETAPENAVPAVLLRSIVAADMTGAKTRISAGGH